MKRFLVNALVVVLLLSSIAFSVFADGNYTDTYFSYFSVKTDVFTLLAERRDKENSTSVYVNFDKMVNPFNEVYVATYGFTATSGIPVNLTVSNSERAPYVICMKGIGYGVHNWIYENGYSQATLGFMSSGTGDVLSGAWSPDSVGTLPIAKYSNR